MPEKCTPMTGEESVRLLRLYQDGLSDDETEQARDMFDQYVFYRTNGKRRTCLCTSCCSLWEDRPDGAKHNDAGYCPQCRQRITWKAIGRVGRNGTYPSLHEEHNLVIMRPASDGALLISAGRIVTDYEPAQFDGWIGDDNDVFPVPTLDFWERRRYYMAPGVLHSWKRDYGIYRGPWGEPYCSESSWIRTASAGEPNPRGSGMCLQPDDGCYWIIGWTALYQTKMRYCAAEDYFNTEAYHLFRGEVSYLARYTRHPQMEMLVKLGHTELIDDMLEHDKTYGNLVNWRASKPHEFFRLTKPAYRAWRAVGAPLAMLPVIRRMGETNRIDDRTVELARPLNAQVLADLVDKSERYQLSLRRLLSYVRETGRARIWIDYVSMAERLDYDLTREDVLLPRDLQQRHDTAMVLLRTEADAAAQKKYKRQIYPSLVRRYELEAEGWLIRVPRSAEEIVTEGRVLCHCVGGYANRHLEGRTTILFLRSADDPDTSLCTIEMNGARLVQIHGYKNDYGQRKPAELYAAILDIWLPWVQGGSPRDQQGRPIIETETEVISA